MPGVRLAVLDGGSFVRTYAGELRPESDRFNSFVEAVARAGTFVDVAYIVPVRHVRIWEVEPPLDPVDESMLRIVPTRRGPMLPGDRKSIDEAVAASDLLWLRLPARHARHALAAARKHGVPVVGWGEGGDARGTRARAVQEAVPMITSGPELFASVVTGDELEATKRFDATGGGDQTRLVWAIGAVLQRDDVRTIAAAAAELRARGKNVTLVVLADGPVAGAFERHLDELAAAGAETYGYVGDRRSYMDVLRRGDVLIHVSQAEDVPNVVVDALAAGLPVIARETASLRQILGDGERGLLVPAADTSGLASAINSVLDDAQGLVRMRESALQWAATNTADIHARRLVERLHELFPTLDW